MPWRLKGGWAWGVLGVLVVVGLALRLARYGDAVFGDELSTLFAIRGSLSETISFVASDGEISPPLYFVLAWLASDLGSAPELVRLPALVAGVTAIPLTYAVGLRTVGRGAGLVAATVMALSPFMIFYSTDGRAYTVAIALLLGSTLAMLAAAETGRRSWWVTYAACSCLAMYAHYTSAFILVAQLGWLAWFHRQALRSALVANVGAALLFAPWIPSLLADTRSPTIEILEALQGSGVEVKLEAIATWAFGYPFVGLSQVPGRVALLAAVGGLLIAAAWGLRQWVLGGGSWRRPSPGVALLLALALATPAVEILLLGLGTDILGARNLNISSAGLALAIGSVLASAGPRIGAACTLAVLATFGLGAAQTLEPENTVIALDQAAASIEVEAREGDVVVDAFSALVSPVPLTPLDLYLPEREVDYEPFLPTGDPPFLPFKSPPRPAEELLAEAFERAEGKRVFIVLGERDGSRSGSISTEEVILSPLSPTEPLVRFRLPAGSRLVDSEAYEGIVDVRVGMISVGG